MQLFIIFAIYVAIVTGHKLEPYQTMHCQSRKGLVPAIQTVILDLDESFNDTLKTCIIKTTNIVNSVLLINNNYTKNYVTLERCKTDDHPTVIIFTKQITFALLGTPSVKGVLKSHRSILYIVVSDNKNFTCKNDVMATNDFLYLESFMNELWHKYKIAHVGVTFPLNCYGNVAVYGNKRKTNHTLYDRTIMLVNYADFEKLQAIFGQKRIILTEDYPLRANIFERYPTVISQCDNLHYYYKKMNLNITGGYCGLDAFVMHTIVEHFKFKLELLNDEKCNAYGYNSGTNITGSLGCINRKELDISFNSRFMTMYSPDQVYFLHFVTVDSLCVMVKQADVIPIWLHSISIYTPSLWFIIVSLNVVIGFFWWKTAPVNKKQKRNKRKEFFLYVKNAFITTMFGISSNYSESRLLKGISLCSSIMFLALYQGHINHIFTTLVRYDNIKTLAELYKSDIVLQVTPSMWEILKQIHNKENKDERNFMKRIKRIEKDEHSLDMLLKIPNAALVGRKKDVKIAILTEYTASENKHPFINIVNECLRTYYLSFIGRPGFPFVEELQRFMQRVREAGLAEIYYEWTCGMLRVPSNLPKIRNAPRHFESIKLDHLRLAFGLLGLGQIISLFIFIIELWKARGSR